MEPLSRPPAPGYSVARTEAVTGAGAQGIAGPSVTSSSVETLGSHSSQLGRYQFQSPSSFIVAGSSTERMIVASMSTATPKPKPDCCPFMSRPRAKVPKILFSDGHLPDETPSLGRAPLGHATQIRPTPAHLDARRSRGCLEVHTGRVTLGVFVCRALCA